MGLFDWFKRRRTGKRFADYVDPEVIKLIEQDPSKYFSLELKEQHFQWVLINLRDRPPGEINELANKVVESCFRQQSVVSGIMFSLVLAHFGTLCSEDKVEKRLALVNDLVEQNRDRVRIAHGQCTGWVGNIGGQHRLSWEAVVPGFNSVLRTLLDTDFGTAIEISEAPARTPPLARD